MEILHTSPTPSSFTPLSVHQSQTPESFYSGPPILHRHSPSATLVLHASDLAAAPALSGLVNGAHKSTNGTAGANGHGEAAVEEEEDGQDEELVVEGVDVWVTSARFILFSPTSTTGLSIPYTSISLHAIQRPSQAKPASLFLQLLAQPQTFDDHDPDSTISITLIPAAAPAPPNPAETPASEPAAEARGEVEAQEPARLLYAALSACANLHPDPPFDNDDDEGDAQQSSANILFDGDRQDQDAAGIYPLSNGEGGVGGALPPPMPGSGGWITAENVGEFFDEAGNFRERRLGGGAGNVRGREEIVDGDVDGDGDGDGDGKDGGDVEDEGPKWRRTG